MTGTNFMQVLGEPDECAKHGRAWMARMLEQETGWFVVGGERCGQDKPVYICIACQHEAYYRVRDLLRRVAENRGVLGHHSSCCEAGPECAVTPESCVCTPLEKEVHAEFNNWPRSKGTREPTLNMPVVTTLTNAGAVADAVDPQARWDAEVARRLADAAKKGGR